MVILVTGGVAVGKTRLLERLARALAPRWRVGGVLAPAVETPRPRGAPAAAYHLQVLGEPRTLPWARRRDVGPGYRFDEAAATHAADTVRSRLVQGPFEVFLLDEIGPLELQGGGLSDPLRAVLASATPVIVAAVRPGLLEAATRAFELARPWVVDLDSVSPGAALRACLRRVRTADAERIGAFAGVGGLVEVGLGSALHAWRVPFKGHVLAYLQTALLATFGKPLRGRGLARISLLSALLKAFSPAGATFKPMAYIFVQGCTFAAPVRALGWNLPAVLLGSVLMAWLTLGLSLAVDYVTFGQSVFDAFAGLLDTLSGWLGVPRIPLVQALAGLFVLKALLALGIGAAAWLGDLRPLFERLRRQRVALSPGARAARETAGRRSFARSALDAGRDLLRPRAVLLLLVTVLVILAFANLSGADAIVVAVRALSVTYLGLLAARRLDLHALAGRLDRRFGLGLADALPAALRVLDGTPPGPSAGSSDP